MPTLKNLFSSAVARRSARPDTRFAQGFRKASQILGWLVLALSLTELLLQFLRAQVFSGNLLNEVVPHQPAAAQFCFALIAIAVLSVQRAPMRTRPLQTLFGAAVFIVGFLSVNSESLTKWWMDPLTAWVVLLLGLILMAGASRMPVIGYIRQLITFVVFFLCALVLVGYVYEVSEMHKNLLQYLRIPWTSSLFGLLAGHALLFQHPNFGVMRVMSAEGFGSDVARRLLPTSILLLAGLGWLLAFGENYELYPASFGESLYAVLAITGFSGMLLVTATYLNRLDVERRAGERQVRRSQHQLQAILDNTPSPICMKDLEGTYLLVNQSFSRTFGFAVKDMVGRSVFDILPEAEARHVHSRFQEAVEKRAPVEVVDTITVNGVPRSYLSVRFPLLDPEGAPYAVCAVYTDITDIKRQEEEIKHLNQSLREKARRQEAANSELEAFSYSVSHDLRAPLRHIAGFGQLLLQRHGPILDEKGKHYLDVILVSVARMGALIDDLLAFSRASKVEISWKRIRTQDVVEDVRAELLSRWTGPAVTWDVGHLPDVEGDPSMVRLVWVNLLSNAMKYSGKNPAPHISIHCVPNGEDEEVFSVKDNGAGFDMRYADKLFGVFQRLHSNQEYEGTGIGLAMIRRILERHGGRIWAESSPGLGACFYFVMPTTRSAAARLLASEGV
jgi:PAS domain S-box-containing protein